MFADIVCIAAAISILAAGGLTVGWLTIIPSRKVH